jgi:Kelch motif
MSFSSHKIIPSNNRPATGFASQSTQQLQPVCTWSAHAPQSGPSPSPFPRDRHSLTATATAAGELFLFGGYLPDCASSSDLYVFSTRDFSTTLLQTSGEPEVPTPRYAHGSVLIGTTLLICGGKTNSHESVPNDDSLYLLNLGTSDLLMSSPTPADHGFAFRITRVVPRCGRWSRAGWSLLPYHNGGRFQALRLRWSDWREDHQ